MSYRDDRDADQARIQALEGELALAKQKIAELEGKNEQALVLATRPGTGLATQRFLGGPMRLVLERTFDGAFPTDKFEDLVERIRDFMGERGRTELLKSSVAWWTTASDRGIGPFTNVSVTVRDGKTIVRATDRLNQLAAALYGGFGGGIGGGGVVAPIMVTVAMPLLAPLAFGVWFGGTYALARTLFKRTAKKRAQQLQRLFEVVESAVAREIA